MILQLQAKTAPATASPCDDWRDDEGIATAAGGAPQHAGRQGSAEQR